jgi:hypothetical protein
MSTPTTTVARSLHDLGLASWFGGSLMGALGLNAGAAAARSPRERTRISAAGWQRWSPVLVASMAAHVAGSVGMLLSDTPRLLAQPAAQRSAALKTALTLAAVGASAYSGILGRVQSKHQDEGGISPTEPLASASPEMSSAQRQQKWVQWATPAITAVLIVLAAQQGEQQRRTAPTLTAPDVIRQRISALVPNALALVPNALRRS